MNGSPQVPLDMLQRAYWAFMQQNGRQPTREELVSIHALAQQQAFIAQQQGGPLPRAPVGVMPPALGPMMPQPATWGRFPFPTGEASVPPAGWEQQPDRPVEKYRSEHSQIRWGDTSIITITQNPLATTPGKSGYVLDCELWRPCTCVVRLSVTSPDLAALSATWLCTWQLTVGVGSSAQDKFRQVQIAPETDGTVDTDIVLTWPLQKLRVVAAVQVGAGAATVVVHATAHVAPVTNFEGVTK